MSDGPHRSLPLARRWKKVTEVAYNPACSLTEIEEKMRLALKRDFKDAPVTTVFGILLNGTKDRLFPDSEGMIKQLGDLAASHKPSTAKDALIECAIAGVHQGISSEDEAKEVIGNTVRMWTGRHQRSIEEHVQRESPPERARELRARLDATVRQLDVAQVASDLAMGQSLRPRTERPSKDTGLDTPGPRIMPEAA